MSPILLVSLALLAIGANAAAPGSASKTIDLECMFLGYPELEYDGFDRTEVIRILKFINAQRFLGAH